MLLVMAGHNASLSLRMEDGGVTVSSELLTQRKLERQRCLGVGTGHLLYIKPSAAVEN